MDMEKFNWLEQLGDRGARLTSYPIMELLSYANCEVGIFVEMSYFPPQPNQINQVLPNSISDGALGIGAISIYTGTVDRSVHYFFPKGLIQIGIIAEGSALQCQYREFLDCFNNLHI